QAARIFAAENSGNPEQAALLETAAAAALGAFATGGFNAVIERVPAEERDRFLGFAVPVIQLSLTRLRDLDLMQRGLDPIDYEGENGPRETQWLQQALLALSTLPDYPAPLLLSMTGFDHIEASVFQVARSPGQNTVYLGCLFLVIGVFSMFYVRDRRIWVWVQPNGTGSHWLAAMTSQRRNLDFDREFGEFKAAINTLSS
ncbi:MAG: cytochrome c biogenesis protein ResB, partial [Pusillimonas sp.]